MKAPALGLLLLVSLAWPPRAQGVALQQANCAKAAQYSESHRGSSVLVIQDGKTVFEHYANGAGVDSAWPIFSGTKSFWGIAALHAVDQGLFRLDDRVSDTITEWKSDPRKSQITIRQLLNFTDGLPPDPHLHSSSIRDRNARALQEPSMAQPGSAFAYGPSHLQVFSELLRRKLGHNIIPYLQEHVLNPLGIGPGLDFKTDGRGNPLLASGFQLSARQWSNFGQMILNHGSFNGTQIVSADSMRQMLTGSNANPAYGLTIWLNRPAGFLAGEADIEKLLDLPWQRVSWRGVSISKSAPPDMVVGLGSNYHRLFVIPSWNAIIVRQASASSAVGSFSDGNFLRLLIGK